MADINPEEITCDDFYEMMVNSGELRINRLKEGIDPVGDGLANRVADEIYCLLGTKPLNHKLYLNSISGDYYLWLSVENLERSQSYIMSALEDWFRGINIGRQEYWETAAKPLSVRTFGGAAYISLELSIPSWKREANILRHTKRIINQGMAEISQSGYLCGDLDLAMRIAMRK